MACGRQLALRLSLCWVSCKQVIKTHSSGTVGLCLAVLKFHICGIVQQCEFQLNHRYLLGFIGVSFFNKNHNYHGTYCCWWLVYIHNMVGMGVSMLFSTMHENFAKICTVFGNLKMGFKIDSFTFLTITMTKLQKHRRYRFLYLL